MNNLPEDIITDSENQLLKDGDILGHVTRMDNYGTASHQVLHKSISDSAVQATQDGDEPAHLDRCDKAFDDYKNTGMLICKSMSQIRDGIVTGAGQGSILGGIAGSLAGSPLGTVSTVAGGVAGAGLGSLVGAAAGGTHGLINSFTKSLTEDDELTIIKTKQALRKALEQ